MARAKLQCGRGTMDDDIIKIVTSTVTNIRTRKKVRVDLPFLRPDLITLNNTLFYLATTTTAKKTENEVRIN